MILVDSHCHLDDERYDQDRAETIGRAFEAGVGMMLAIGTGGGPPHLDCAIQLAETDARIWATVGVHPHDAAKCDASTMSELRRLGAHPKVVAMGEIGLDYHYDFSPREVQRAVFAGQIALARELGKPVVIHTREAWDDTIHMLEGGATGIMHCFSGGVDEMRASVELGLHVSFSGIVTFPKALDIQAAACEVPLDRILIETDAPYLAPVPHRGKRNEPAFVAHVAAFIARLRGMSVEEVAGVTTANFQRLCLRGAQING